MLSLVALASLLIVFTLPERSLSFSADRDQRRSFKGHGLSTELTAGPGAMGVTPTLALVEVPDGLDATIEGKDGSYVLSVSSKFAGAFRGLKVRVGVGDPLGIFMRYEIREVRTVFEFLPTYLIQVREPILVSAAMLGDYPAGRSGFGQEFYSAETYTSSHSSKDIMWKRLAKSPSESLLARVGEANIPERLTVFLIEQRGAPKRRNPGWMNLTSEAVARIGISVVSIGSTLRLVHRLGDRTTVTEARNVSELADLVMSLWRDDVAKRTSVEESSQADIVVAGQDELMVPETLSLVSHKPTVILAWGRGRTVVGPGVINFTGTEDISRLVVGVLSR